jgi:hypothetical protein
MTNLVFPVHDYYVTFGVQYGKKVGSTPHPLRMQTSGYAVIEARDLAEAQRIAHEVFDVRYAFVYDQEHFIDDGTAAKWHPDGELMRIHFDGRREIVNERALQGAVS